jgi:hypothetical protein
MFIANACGDDANATRNLAHRPLKQRDGDFKWNRNIQARHSENLLRDDHSDSDYIVYQIS